MVSWANRRRLGMYWSQVMYYVKGFRSEEPVRMYIRDWENIGVFLSTALIWQLSISKESRSIF